MNLDAIVNELRAQQRRVNAALVALVGSAEEVAAPVTEHPESKMEPVITMPHRKMSPGVRRKISSSMKKTWAERSKPKHTLPSTVKDKISVSQKARWAVIKEAAAQAGAQNARHAAMTALPALPNTPSGVGTDHGTNFAAA